MEIKAVLSKNPDDLRELVSGKSDGMGARGWGVGAEEGCWRGGGVGSWGVGR